MTYTFLHIDNFIKPYKYKYNGKEHQDELGLGLYDYGFRNYDPALGRWLNPDPLSEEYSSWSPYNYAVNNPVYFLDPNGLWVDDYQLNKDGTVDLIKRTDDKSDTLYASNEDGSVDKSKSVTVQKESATSESVISGLAGGRDWSLFKQQTGFKDGKGDVSIGYTNSVDDAVNVFNFVNENTNSNIEFGLMRFEKNGNGDNYLVGTNHQIDDLSKTFNSMINQIGGYNNLIAFYHNHDGVVGANPHTIGNQFGADQNTRRIVHAETLKSSKMLSRFFTVHEGLGNRLIELNRNGRSMSGQTMTPGTVGSIGKININDVKK